MGIGPQINCTIVETKRQSYSTLALEGRLLAEHIDANRDIRPGLLTRHLTQTRRQTVKCADNSIHAW